MKTMKQPRKDVLREQLALAAEEIIRLKTALAQWERQAWEYQTATPPQWKTPWWRRLLAWGRA